LSLDSCASSLMNMADDPRLNGLLLSDAIQDTDVHWDQTWTGPRLTLKSTKPGPIVTIEPDGSVTVNKGPYDEAGRMFWDAVRIAGSTYRERIKELETVVDLLQHDPYKRAVFNGFAVYKELQPTMKKRMVYTDVAAVLEAINNIAMRSVQ
jgi:hypothetical protein